MTGASPAAKSTRTRGDRITKRNTPSTTRALKIFMDHLLIGPHASSKREPLPEGGRPFIGCASCLRGQAQISLRHRRTARRHEGGRIHARVLRRNCVNSRELESGHSPRGEKVAAHGQEGTVSDGEYREQASLHTLKDVWRGK